MSNEEKFFKHPETGEILPDKRSSQKIETILAKVAISQETTEAIIKNIERVQVANTTMLENLLRSECTLLKTELKNHDENNKKDYLEAVTKQRGINEIFKNDIIGIKHHLKEKFESINERLDKIENKPIKKKAEVVDKLLLALIGGGITIIVTNIYNILTMLLK